jgi:hypothetical protein
MEEQMGTEFGSEQKHKYGKKNFWAGSGLDVNEERA